MTSVVVNGVTYSDDGSSANDMLNGGHTTNFLECISDTMVEVANAVAAADAAETSAAEALASGFKFTFSTTTAMADPGAGTVRFNNATIASVTALAFDATSADIGNPDVSDFIATWGSSTSTTKGYVTFRKIGTPATFVIFAVTDAVTDNTGWLQITVSYVAGSGTISNTDVLAVAFDKVADKGADGAVSLATAQTLQNKSLEDSTTFIIDNSDNTKKGQFQASSISTATTRTYTLPNSNGTIALTSDITGTNSGTNTGDQNLFSTIAVSGQSNVVADSTSDTLTLAAGSNVTITTNAGSDTITIAATAVPVGNHVVDVSTGNGHGSTNTVIRRFTTTVESAGTAITYADSGTNGATFTINEDGMYSIFYSERTSSNGMFGVSVNSNQLTTGIPSITASHRVALGDIKTTSTGHSSTSCVVRLAATDVVRAHTEGNLDGSTAAVRFTIRKIGPA